MNYLLIIAAYALNCIVIFYLIVAATKSKAQLNSQEIQAAQLQKIAASLETQNNLLTINAIKEVKNVQIEDIQNKTFSVVSFDEWLSKYQHNTMNYRITNVM